MGTLVAGLQVIACLAAIYAATLLVSFVFVVVGYVADFISNVFKNIRGR